MSCAKYQVAQELVTTAVAMVNAMVQLILAFVIRDGQESGVIFQIVQELQTVTTGDFVTPRWSLPRVLTAQLVGWDQAVAIRVCMVNKCQWIAVTVFAFQVIQE